MIAPPTFARALTAAPTGAETELPSVNSPDLTAPASTFGELLTEEAADQVGPIVVSQTEPTQPARAEAGREGGSVTGGRGRTAVQAIPSISATAAGVIFSVPATDGPETETETYPTKGAEAVTQAEEELLPAAPLLEALGLLMWPAALVPAPTITLLGKNGPLEPAESPMAFPAARPGEPVQSSPAARRVLEPGALPGDLTAMAAALPFSDRVGTTNGSHRPAESANTAMAVTATRSNASPGTFSETMWPSDARGEAKAEIPRRGFVSENIPAAAAAVTPPDEAVPERGAAPTTGDMLSRSGLDGIPAAKTSMAMKKMEQPSLRSAIPASPTTRTARVSSDSAETADAVPALKVGPIPVHEKLQTATADHPLWLGAAFRQFERSTPARELEAVPAFTAAPLLESQVHGAIAELKRLQPDSMSVVLRPDEKTEVHLHLQLVDGAVEVEARLQRGDPGALGAEWVQLQQNLSSQGVRLSSLQENSPSQGSLPGGGLTQGGQHDKASEPEGAPTHRAGVPSPSRPAGSPARPSSPPPAKPGRAWETWA